MASGLTAPTRGFAWFLIRWRWPVLIVGIGCLLAMSAGGLRLSFSTDYRAFFSAGSKDLADLRRLQTTFGVRDALFMAVRTKSGDAFGDASLKAVRELTAKIMAVPGVQRVASLTNQTILVADDEGFKSRPLVPDREKLTDAERSEARKAALADPFLVHRLISKDAKTAGLIIDVSIKPGDNRAIPVLMARLRALEVEFRRGHPGIETGLTGVVALNDGFQTATRQDLWILVPVMAVVLIVVLAFFLRNIAAVIGTLLVVGLSTGGAMGMAGWLGVALTPPTGSAPVVIMTLAVANSVHLLVAFLRRRQAKRTPGRAIAGSLAHNAYPIILTSLTTMVGLLCLNFSDAPPFRQLGNLTAFGVSLALIIALVILPAFLAVWPGRAPKRPPRATASLLWLAGLIAPRPRLIAGVFGLIVVGAAVLVPRLTLSDDYYRYLDRSVPVRAGTEFVVRHLAGVCRMNWIVRAETKGGISDPKEINKIAEFVTWLRKQPDIRHALAASDIIQSILERAGADARAQIDIDKESIDATFDMIDETPSGRAGLSGLMSRDRTDALIVATAGDVSSAWLANLNMRARAELQRLGLAERADGPLGACPTFGRIAETNISAMLIGTAVAFAVIGIILVFALGSIRYGLLSLVPNLFPPLIAFGVWSLLVGKVGLAASVIAATSLGLIVDATIHFLTRYVRARRHGRSAEGSVREALRRVGPAIWVAGLVLIAGFATLALSSFQVTRELGILTALTLAIALITDFILLPAALLLLDRRRSSKQGMNGS